MLITRSLSRAAIAGALAVSFSACNGLGNIGNVLGGVLGTGGSQVQGTVLAVDGRSQYVTLQDQNGQAISLQFDNRTRVVFNNQNYSVNSLQRGDVVTANVQTNNNNSNSYYTDYIQVDQSMNGGGGTVMNGNGSVQSFEGTVRQIDYQNGWFTIDSNNGRYTVTMPYSPRTSDVNTFRSLRVGQYARIYGVYLNNGRIELRQFY